MKPNHGEGKILKDLEQVNNLKCMIEEPTRITTNSETLLDIVLTKLMLLKCSRNVELTNLKSVILG